jgi:hypothetical protein
VRLRDLHPTLKGSRTFGVLSFDCPSGKPHKIRVHVHSAPYAEINGVKYWQVNGEFPDTLTVSPSINEQHIDLATGEVKYQCWHGTISGGDVR